MTPEESRIIKFHEKMALWCAMNSRVFNDYCMGSSIYKEGINEMCDSFFTRKISHEICLCEDKYLDSNSLFTRSYDGFDYILDYHNFCKNRLVEESDFSFLDDVSTQRKPCEWYDFFDDGVVDNNLFSYLFQEEAPLSIISNNLISEIFPETVLPFCDELKNHKILFDALISLLFNAILQENDLDMRAHCCKLLQDELIDKKEHKYSKSSCFYSALIQLNSNICESFFKGFGMSIKEYDSLLSFIDRGNEDDAIHEIANMRKNNLLGNESILIEYCVDFQKAQKLNQYIDWSKRFSFDNDIQSINALLLKWIQKDQLISQDIINSLLNSICPNVDFTAIKLASKKRDGDQKNRNKERRFISLSTRFVNKAELIRKLIDNDWVAVNHGRNEVETRLNYFFNDGSSDKLPSDLNYTIEWHRDPKAQLICLLIRMLYNKKWDFKAEDVVIREVIGKDGKRVNPGINSKVVAPLSNALKIWGPVKKSST